VSHPRSKKLSWRPLIQTFSNSPRSAASVVSTFASGASSTHPRYASHAGPATLPISFPIGRQRQRSNTHIRRRAPCTPASFAAKCARNCSSSTATLRLSPLSFLLPTSLSVFAACNKPPAASPDLILPHHCHLLPIPMLRTALRSLPTRSGILESSPVRHSAPKTLCPSASHLPDPRPVKPHSNSFAEWSGKNRPRQLRAIQISLGATSAPPMDNSPPSSRYRLPCPCQYVHRKSGMRQPIGLPLRLSSVSARSSVGRLHAQ